MSLNVGKVEVRSYRNNKEWVLAVFRIRDVFIRIRIRTLYYGSRSCCHCISLQRQQVNKKSENCRNHFSRFCSLFCLLMEGYGSEYVQIMTDLDPGGLKTYLELWVLVASTIQLVLVTSTTQSMEHI